MHQEPRSQFSVISDRDAAMSYCASHGIVIGDDSSIRGICLMREDAVIAACLYHENNGSNAWVHVAGTPGTPWLNRAFLHNAFRYPFVTLGLRRVSAWVEATNHQSIKFIEHIGFTREATHPQAGRDGVDVHIYSMFRDQCRYA